MNISTKYNIEEVVHAVALRDKYDDFECETCKGEGSVKDEKGNWNYCPECDCYKTVSKKVGKYFEINIIKIFGIIITKEQKIYYQRISQKFLEENISLTLNEAQIEINEYKKENNEVDYFDNVVIDHTED